VQHEHWPSKPYQIGPLLNKAVSTFKCYSDYAANWPKSLMVLGRWRQKAPFVEWLASLRDDPVVGRQSIDDLLALPFDRISRYASMLDDLLRLTEDDHPEYDGLALALSKMKAFAESFYDLKRKVRRRDDVMRQRSLDDWRWFSHSRCGDSVQFEFMALVYQTQTKIANAPNLVKPHRRLIREGELMELLTNEFGARSGALRYEPHRALVLLFVLVLTLTNERLAEPYTCSRTCCWLPCPTRPRAARRCCRSTVLRFTRTSRVHPST